MQRVEITEKLRSAILQHFHLLGHSVLTEFTLKTGRRVDVICLDKNQHITVIEIKSSKEDFLSDQKWPEYLEWAHQFYFAVWEDFDLGLLNDTQPCGILISDGYQCHLTRQAEEMSLAPARRHSLIQRLARTAMDRASAPYLGTGHSI